MDFNTSVEQDALRDAVRALLTRRYPSTEDRRKVVETVGYDDQLWQRLAEIGVLALPFAEEVGGVGAGAVEVAVVAEEFGRVLAPEPFTAVVVLAGGLIAEVGTIEQQRELLPPVAEGRTTLAFAGNAPHSRWSDAGDGVDAVMNAGEWRLSGSKEPVLHGGDADLLLVSAAAGDVTGLFLVQGDAVGLTRTSYRGPDGSLVGSLSFRDTPATRLGHVDIDQSAAIARVLDRARLAWATEAVGALQVAVDLTSAYLKTRRQFGTPLSANQALIHRAADMLVALEMARSTVTWATAVQEAADGGDTEADVSLAVAHAWLQVCKASRLVGQEAIQLHGGIGLTAEYSVGHYVKRLVTLERLAGDGNFHRARLSRSIASRGSLDPVG